MARPKSKSSTPGSPKPNKPAFSPALAALLGNAGPGYKGKSQREQGSALSKYGKMTKRQGKKF